jgi:hypothetical protein
MRKIGGSARLDQFVLDIEFLLISVVQGVALSALAAAAIGPITTLQYQYWPYIISAFLVIFIFWSQAIIHALSFIDWPLDLAHNLFYFLASFVQVIAFSQITNPNEWFVGMTVLFAVAFLLYIVDYKIILNRKNEFVDENEKALYKHLKKQHELDMYITVPVGFIVNAVSAYLIFTGKVPHLYLISLQLFFQGIVLYETIQSFKKRSGLIESVHRG